MDPFSLLASAASFAAPAGGGGGLPGITSSSSATSGPADQDSEVGVSFGSPFVVGSGSAESRPLGAAGGAGWLAPAVIGGAVLVAALVLRRG